MMEVCCPEGFLEPAACDGSLVSFSRWLLPLRDIWWLLSAESMILHRPLDDWLTARVRVVLVKHYTPPPSNVERRRLQHSGAFAWCGERRRLSVTHSRRPRDEVVAQPPQTIMTQEDTSFLSFKSLLNTRENILLSIEKTIYFFSIASTSTTGILFLLQASYKEKFLKHFVGLWKLFAKALRKF